MENRYKNIDRDDLDIRREIEADSDAVKDSIIERSNSLLDINTDIDLSEDNKIRELILEYSDMIVEYSEHFDGGYLDPALHEIHIGPACRFPKWKVIQTENGLFELFNDED